MQRTASVDDMVGNLWRLGRTPSQAEFEQFFSNIAQVGSQQNLALAGQEGGEAANGIPRVASIGRGFRSSILSSGPFLPIPIPFPSPLLSSPPSSSLPHPLHPSPPLAPLPTPFHPFTRRIP